MREILFRGKRKEDGIWLFGHYFKYDDTHNVVPDKYSSKPTGWHQIDPETLGQFTGYEMFNNKVFFGDLVSNNYGTNKEVIREIVECEGNKMMKRVKGNGRLPKYISLHEYRKFNFRVISNIHDSPELLK